MKYDLEQMLREIKRDENEVELPRHKQMTQKEIRAMVEKRRKKGTQA